MSLYGHALRGQDCSFTKSKSWIHKHTHIQVNLMT